VTHYLDVYTIYTTYGINAVALFTVFPLYFHCISTDF
jgi:hypothetical protein